MSTEAMTPEQKNYYDKELARIRRGGSDIFEPWMQDSIGGMGSHNLGPVDPPVVGISADDPHYYQCFQNWDEVNKLIKQLEEQAIKAWGPKP
jgi:hypothetical protein